MSGLTKHQIETEAKETTSLAALVESCPSPKASKEDTSLSDKCASHDTCIRSQAAKTPRRTDLVKLETKYKIKNDYESLLAHCKNKPNAARNCAMLRGLQKHLGRSLKDDASHDLNDDAATDCYFDKVGWSDNRRSALTYLRSICRTPTERGFAELVGQAIALATKTIGSMATLAREIGVSRSTLHTLANGRSQPGASNQDALRALERISGFEEGSLTQHISENNNAFVFKNQYFDLKNPTYSPHRFSTAILPLSGNAIAQTRAFIEFKICGKATHKFVF